MDYPYAVRRGYSGNASVIRIEKETEKTVTYFGHDDWTGKWASYSHLTRDKKSILARFATFDEAKAAQARAKAAYEVHKPAVDAARTALVEAVAAQEDAFRQALAQPSPSDGEVGK